MRYVALLRGINVGGNKKVPMGDLRALMVELGHEEVQTYLQSGNVVFSSTRRGAAKLAAEIETAVHETVGVECRVLVRTLDEVRRAVEANPLPEAEGDPSHFHLVFLDARPTPDKIAALTAEDWGSDVLEFGDGVLYVWYRDGLHRSKLATVLDRRLGVATTARNWNTVTKLLAG